MKNQLKKLLILTLTIIMMLPQTVSASNGNGGSNGNTNSNSSGNGDIYEKGDQNIPYGQLKKIEQYSEIDPNRIRVGNRHMKFEVPPVIKGNRTLIPVRAITEALGCEVKWVAPKAYIISPDESKIIIFDLETGSVYVTEDWTYEELLDITNQSIWDSLEVEIDVAPGLLNNRTFVPLRFIAEELGLTVGYNSRTGMIDIDEAPSISPVLTPDEMTFTENETSGLEYVIDMELNGFELIKVTSSAAVEVSNIYYTVEEDTVTIKEAFLEMLNVGITELNFIFLRNTDVETVEVSIIVKEAAELSPVIVPSLMYIETMVELPTTKDIDITLNGYSLKEVKDLVEEVDGNGDYTLKDDLTLTLTTSYLEMLEEPKTVISLVFEKVDEDDLTLDFTIELEYLYLEPVLSPENVTFIEGETADFPIYIDMNLYGFELAVVSDLHNNLEDTDYEVNDVTNELILKESFLSTLEVGTKRLIIKFVRDEEEVYIIYDIIVTEQVE